jgi:hypothetical protein
MPEPKEVLPKSGLVVSEKSELQEILCKPKIIPLKSITLQKLEEMEVSRAVKNSSNINAPCISASVDPGPIALHTSFNISSIEAIRRLMRV